MSITDGPAYCTEQDVREAMQETTAAFDETPLGTANVEAAIAGASRYLTQASNAHWYDSTAADSDLLSNTAATATDISLSIPSSPHPQDGGIVGRTLGRQSDPDYPQRQQGRYSRAKTTAGRPGLPYRFVETIDALRVASYDGDTEDWAAASDKQQGRGEDYWLQVHGGDGYGRSYLYIDAAAIGPRLNLDGVLSVDVTFGLDYQDTAWAEVRRGVGHLAAAELVVDDDVLSAIPDNGSIGSVQTEAEEHLNAAMDRYLGQFLQVGMA